MFAIASAFTLIKGAASLRGTPWNRRRHFVLSVVCLAWYVLARLFISQAAAFAGSFVALSVLLCLASYDYLRLARDRRWLGAAAIGTMLAIVGSSTVVLAASVPAMSAVNGFARNVLLAHMVCYALVALGMLLLVFEDVAGDLQRLAATDPLTGCYNRHHWDGAVRAELKRHDRFKIPLTVMFIDVNHFKRVNDSAGHAAGDRVLVHVAETLRTHIREFDLLCRWGGDEFVILMACDESSAAGKSRELQRVFAESLESGGWPAGLGLSIGVAGVPAGTTDIGPFVRLADERMYADKNSSPGPSLVPTVLGPT
jgi:diguanylate cyclase (GGDEF)-like protein